MKSRPYRASSNIFKDLSSKIQHAETSLVVQWLRLHASNVGGVGSTSGQRTKIPHAWIKKKKKKSNMQSYLKNLKSSEIILDLKIDLLLSRKRKIFLQVK